MGNNDLFIDSGANFSKCRKWRFDLWRIWDKTRPYCLFIALNPSTADEIKNDRTVTRCENFAKKWNYGGLWVCNIFAFRATFPKDMKSAPDPVGPGNDQAILKAAENSGIIICSWGNDGNHKGRGEQVVNLLQGLNLYCLSTTKENNPSHPLYIHGDTLPRRFFVRN